MNGAAKTTAEIVFTMGLPAAGKSTWIAANLADSHTVIDPDAIKESHPDYDPKNPAALHAWSKEISEAMFADALAGGEGLWVVDGTGTNAEKMVRRIRQAEDAGFATRLVFIRCTLETSLLRNAARVRNVPEQVVREKARDVHTAFALISPHAQTVETVDND